MKAERVLFVNARGFKEYAVRFKRNILAKWQWVKDEKGNNKVTNFAEADAVIARLTGEGVAISKEGTENG